MRIRTDKYTFLNGAMCWRLGCITAEKALGGDVTMVDVDGYGPVYHWENKNGYCQTGWMGCLLRLELEV